MSPCPADTAAIGTDPRLASGDVVVVWKAERRIGHYENGRLSHTEAGPGCWTVALAPGAPPGPKRREGDLRTPEGWYRTSDKPTSRFPLAIAVHYPNLADAHRGLTDAVIDAVTRDQIAGALAAGQKPPQATSLGGEILIHGGGSASDWTIGCIALDTADLADLRSRLPVNLAFAVLILP